VPHCSRAITATMPPLLAAQCADEMLERGETVGQSIWKRITAAVEELIRRKPKEGERVN